MATVGASNFCQMQAGDQFFHFTMVLEIRASSKNLASQGSTTVVDDGIRSIFLSIWKSVVTHGKSPFFFFS